MREFLEDYGLIAYPVIGLLLLISLFVVDLTCGHHEFAGNGEIVSEQYTEGHTYTTVDSKGRVGVASSYDEFTIFLRDYSTGVIIKVSCSRNTFFRHKKGDVVEWYRYHGFITGINYSNAIR